MTSLAGAHVVASRQELLVSRKDIGPSRKAPCRKCMLRVSVYSCLSMSYPILEFDDAREALMEPSRLIRKADFPQRCVACFFAEVVDELVAGGAKVAASRTSEIGEHPIYEIMFEGQRLAVTHPGLGGPLAAGLLEEAIALGCRKFIVCGGAGVLRKDVALGHLIVPTSAVRDEGTSYHYLPPAREVQAGCGGCGYDLPGPGCRGCALRARQDMDHRRLLPRDT